MSKGVFQIVVLGFPRYDLRVGTFEVGFELDVAGIAEEEFSDVGENDTEWHC